MKIKTLIAVALLCLGLTAAVQSQVVSQAYEVALSDLRTPATENGGVAFKECDECKLISVRVTSSTHYVINGKTVQLKDFRTAVIQANDRDEKIATVLHHLESDTIVSISVSI